MPQLWYGFNNGFSPCNIYDPWIYQLYNVVFTSLPIMVFAIFDERHNMATSFRHPELYRDGVDNKLFSLTKNTMSLLLPVAYSFLLTTITFLAMERNGLNGAGTGWDLLSEGMTIFA